MVTEVGLVSRWDEMMLEIAINGQADAIATFNRRDYGTSAGRFGIAVLSPDQTLKRIRG